jgi:hypothetical protein
MSWAVGGRTGLILAWFAVLSLVLTLPSAAPGVAPKRACFGKQATKVGTKHGNRIVAKADAVVWAGGGNDTIRVVPPDHTTHVICGGPGDDEVRGGSERDVLVGGPGNDRIEGAPGNDRIVGDKANPNGDSSKGPRATTSSAASVPISSSVTTTPPAARAARSRTGACSATRATTP